MATLKIFNLKGKSSRLQIQSLGLVFENERQNRIAQENNHLFQYQDLDFQPFQVFATPYYFFLFSTVTLVKCLVWPQVWNHSCPYYGCNSRLREKMNFFEIARRPLKIVQFTNFDYDSFGFLLLSCALHRHLNKDFFLIKRSFITVNEAFQQKMRKNPYRGREESRRTLYNPT